MFAFLLALPTRQSWFLVSCVCPLVIMHMTMKNTMLWYYCLWSRHSKMDLVQPTDLVSNPSHHRSLSHNQFNSGLWRSLWLNCTMSHVLVTETLPVTLNTVCVFIIETKGNWSLEHIVPVKFLVLLTKCGVITLHVTDKPNKKMTDEWPCPKLDYRQTSMLLEVIKYPMTKQKANTTAKAVGSPFACHKLCAGQSLMRLS